MERFFPFLVPNPEEEDQAFTAARLCYKAATQLFSSSSSSSHKFHDIQGWKYNESVFWRILHVMLM